MKRLIPTIVALALALGAVNAAETARAKDFENNGHIEYPDWFNKDPFHDLKADVNKAKASNKQGLMVLFTTEGCTYCAAFIQKVLGDPEIASAVQKNFVSVGLEVFDDAEMTDPSGNSIAMKAFAKQEGAGFVPTLAFFDTKGNRVLRKVGYVSPQRFTSILNYVVKKRFDKESLAEYFDRQTRMLSKAQGSSDLIQDPLFGKQPYALDRSRFPADRPLMILFEKPACNECQDFHTDVLALPDVRDQLQRFEVVRLDATDDQTPVVTPEGRRATPVSWFKELELTRVPALLFFDEKGNGVLSTDALVKPGRMLNSLGYVLERAYEKGWTYQRFARTKAIARNLEKATAAQ